MKSLATKISVAAVCLVAFLAVILWSHYAQAQQIAPNFDADAIAVEAQDMSYLQRLCDDLSVITDTQQGIKNVTGSMLFAGDSLNSLAYTSQEEDASIRLNFETVENIDTGEMSVVLNFDDGTEVERMEFPAFTEVDENGEKQTYFEFEGQIYNLQEEIEKSNLLNGTEDCFFFSLFSLFVLVVTIVSIVSTAIDAYKYFAFEEVTVAGVLMLVCEGLMLAVPGGVAVKCGSTALKAAGVSAAKCATKNTASKYIVKQSADTIMKALSKSGTEMVNAGKDFKTHKQLVSYIEEKLGKRAKSQVHHIVEQRLINIKNFSVKKIQNTGNVIRMPDEMHYKITGLYNSKNRDLFKKITGRDCGNMKVREYMDNLSFDEQYEVGIKIVNYYKEQGKYTIEML